MEEIRIKDENCNIILFLDNNKYGGHIFYNDGRITPVDASVFKYFDFLKISQNCSKLESKDNYEVLYDNNTKLYHYFYNGKEDLKMFFLNNGRYAINYLNFGNQDLDLKKIFRFGTKVIITLSLSGLLFLKPHLREQNTPDKSVQVVQAESKDNTTDIKVPITVEYIEDIHLNDVKNMIYSSPYLTEEEKQYLYNPALFTDILPIINESHYLKYQFQQYLSNINIKSYGEDNKMYSTALGYYTLSEPNVLYIRDYEKLNSNNKDTVAHEFIHLCEDDTGYNLLKESCAEIISSEYFSYTVNNAYHTQVRLTKKLMEIIGAEPVWKYVFTGDFGMIEERVKPYLSEEEYNEFLNDLEFDVGDYNANLPKIKSLERLLGILYQNIYNRGISEDEIIRLIDNNDETLVRYYFNPRFINQDNSYYLDFSKSEYRTMDYDEAIKHNALFVYAVSKQEIDFDTAKKMIKAGNYNIERSINYNNPNMNLLGMTEDSNKVFITCYINDEYFENVDVDELVEKGYLEVQYFIVNRKKLTYWEYTNHEYDENASLLFGAKNNTIKGNNSITGMLPAKINIPPISERYKIEEKQDKTM